MADLLLQHSLMFSLQKVLISMMQKAMHTIVHMVQQSLQIAHLKLIIQLTFQHWQQVLL